MTKHLDVITKDKPTQQLNPSLSGVLSVFDVRAVVTCYRDKKYCVNTHPDNWCVKAMFAVHSL